MLVSLVPMLEQNTAKRTKQCDKIRTIAHIPNGWNQSNNINRINQRNKLHKRYNKYVNYAVDM